MHDRRTIGLSDQLYRALGSIRANVSEGYSRSSGKDRAHFYEYALGSAREGRGWCYNGRHILGGAVAEHRTRLLTQIIRLLLTMVPEQRSITLREDSVSYRTDLDPMDLEPLDRKALEDLLTDAPLP